MRHPAAAERTRGAVVCGRPATVTMHERTTLTFTVNGAESPAEAVRGSVIKKATSTTRGRSRESTRHLVQGPGQRVESSIAAS